MVTHPLGSYGGTPRTHTSSRTGTYTYRRNRAEVLAKSDVCWLCGLPGADTADHVIAYSAGGTDDTSNLRPAHSRCNKRRGRKPANQVNLKPTTSASW